MGTDLRERTVTRENKDFEEAEDICFAKIELARLLADPLFRVSGRCRALLRYVAEEYFAGNGTRVKAYIIAVDVLGRPPSFNPDADPIVRIEAFRLRTALDKYYATHGLEGQMRIAIPIGRYVTSFSRLQKTDISFNEDPKLVVEAAAASCDRTIAYIDHAVLKKQMGDNIAPEIYTAFVDLKKAVDSQRAYLRELAPSLEATKQAFDALNAAILMMRRFPLKVDRDNAGADQINSDRILGD